MAVSNSLQNLYVDVQGNVQGGKPGGDPLERVITVRNQGDRLAEIEVWLEPSDMRAEPLRQWGGFDKSDDEIKLQPDESVDVGLSFRIPLQAEPGFYSYDVRVRSPQYPGEEIQRSQQLQVLVSEQDALHTEPKITITPETSSTHPYTLLAGSAIALVIVVENPSRRTDRFFLTCPDLPASWFTVVYPEKLGDGSALVEQTDGLQLNPKEIGQIQLQIHPPGHVPAGNYFPTVRLTSINRSDLVILEIVYLTIPVDDRLQMELLPASRKVPAQEDDFEVRLTNPGNIPRTLAIAAADPERTFAYHIKPQTLTLAPGEASAAILQPRPRHWWRQFWRLREQTIEFAVDVQNVPVKLPRDRLEPASDRLSEAAIDQQPALLAAIPTGKIIWQARRRWLFWLLLVTAGLGVLTTVALVLWYFLVWRPSFRPLLTDFSTGQETYREGDGVPVTFDWQVTNPERIGRLTLINDEQEVTKTYTFEQAIPRELAAFCTVQELPKPTALFSTLLSFNRRLARRPTNTQALACSNVPLEPFTVEEGTYDFQLEVFPLRRGDVASSVSDRQEVEKVAIAPPAPPAIRTFSATATAYSLVTPETLAAASDTALNAANRSDAAVAPTTTQTNPADPGAEAASPSEDAASTSATGGRPLAPIRLNWEITNFEDIESLRLVSLAPDGSENIFPETFDFTDGVPDRLQRFCQATDNILNCNQVITTASQVGEYVFYLIVTPRRHPEAAEIVESTATIPIKPPLPEIVSFALNGEEGQQRPKHVFVVNPARGSLDVALTWEVKNATQVELMPAPGVIQGSSITYTVSATPGAEIITLRAINELEEAVTQSIVVEKVGFDPAQPVDPAAAANAEAEGVLPPPPTTIPVPTVTIPSPAPRLPPAEEPPRAN